mmetsp:Transcript_63507/g.200861  ORF Transcript_63507/g.200861 Transcript_63507/m.200861 type:complete len:209 (-) Transcript_63507:1075-1701(-)
MSHPTNSRFAFPASMTAVIVYTWMVSSFISGALGAITLDPCPRAAPTNSMVPALETTRTCFSGGPATSKALERRPMSGPPPVRDAGGLWMTSKLLMVSGASTRALLMLWNSIITTRCPTTHASWRPSGRRLPMKAMLPGIASPASDISKHSLLAPENPITWSESHWAALSIDHHLTAPSAPLLSRVPLSGCRRMDDTPRECPSSTSTK